MVELVQDPRVKDVGGIATEHLFDLGSGYLVDGGIAYAVAQVV